METIIHPSSLVSVSLDPSLNKSISTPYTLSYRLVVVEQSTLTWSLALLPLSIVFLAISVSLLALAVF